MRPIDGDALVDFWSADFTEEEIHKLHIPLAVAIENIKDAPTIDAVPVVQCKDCKHWDGVPADETQDHECHLFDGNEEKIRIATPSYWFCPMGERRSE